MADDDAALLRLLAPFRNLGEAALLNLARMAGERSDSFDNIIRIGRQDAMTVDNVIRFGRQDTKTVDNIIMLGVEPKETLGTMIQAARDRNNAEKWEKARSQFLSKWLAILGSLGAVLAFFQIVVPWISQVVIPSIIALLRKGTG